MDRQFCAVQHTRKEDDIDIKEEIGTQGQETTEGSKGNDPSE